MTRDVVIRSEVLKGHEARSRMPSDRSRADRTRLASHTSRPGSRRAARPFSHACAPGYEAAVVEPYRLVRSSRLYRRSRVCRVGAWKSSGLVLTQARNSASAGSPFRRSVSARRRAISASEKRACIALWQIWCSCTVPSFAPPFSFGVRWWRLDRAPGGIGRSHNGQGGAGFGGGGPRPSLSRRAISLLVAAAVDGGRSGPINCGNASRAATRTRMCREAFSGA